MSIGQVCIGKMYNSKNANQGARCLDWAVMFFTVCSTSLSQAVINGRHSISNMKNFPAFLVFCFSLLSFACTQDVNRSAALEYELVISDRFDQPVKDFLPGKEIRIALSAINDGGSSQALYFSNGQEAEFELWTEAGARIWLWSDGMVFADALHEREVAGGSSVTAEAILCVEGSQVGVDPECPALDSGVYQVRGWFLGTGEELEASINIL